MSSPGGLSSVEIDEIFTVAYAELRRLAGSIKQNDQNFTLNPTALVNEAWLRLRNSGRVSAESPLHFKRIAARAMRQILVEAARRRQASKRGGSGNAPMLRLSDAAETASSPGLEIDEVLALEEALHDLERLNARQAQLVEARFFGGLEVNELVIVFAISEATVMRDWRMARAWLAHRLSLQ